MSDDQKEAISVLDDRLIQITPDQEKLAVANARIKAKQYMLDKAEHAHYEQARRQGRTPTAAEQGYFNTLRSNVTAEVFAEMEDEEARAVTLTVSMPAELKGVMIGLVVQMLPPIERPGPAFQVSFLMHPDAAELVSNSSVNVWLGHYNDPMHKQISNIPLIPNQLIMELEGELAKVEDMVRNSVARYEGDKAIRALETAHGLVNEVIASAKEITNALTGQTIASRINPQANYPSPRLTGSAGIPGTTLQEFLLRLDRLKTVLDPVAAQPKKG